MEEMFTPTQRGSGELRMISFLVTGMVISDTIYVGFYVKNIDTQRLFVQMSLVMSYQNIGANFFMLPRANDENYLRNLTELIERYDVSYVIPTSEPELRYLTEIETYLPSNVASKMIWSSRSVRN